MDPHTRQIHDIPGGNRARPRRYTRSDKEERRNERDSQTDDTSASSSDRSTTVQDASVFRRRHAHARETPRVDVSHARKKITKGRRPEPRTNNIGKNSETRTGYQSAGNRSSNSSEPPSRRVRSGHKGSLREDIFKDLADAPRAAYDMGRTVFPYLRWVIFLYALWLLATHMVMTAYHGYVKAVCGGRFASWTPGCPSSSQETHMAVPLHCQFPWSHSLFASCASGQGGTVDAKTMIDSASAAQASLNDAMRSVGQNHELCRELVYQETALRDLAIRVRASNLDRRKDLGGELGTLVKLTDDAIWYLVQSHPTCGYHLLTLGIRSTSAFTARLSKSMDLIVSTNEHASRKMALIEAQQNQTVSPSEVMLSLLNPLSAFLSGQSRLTEKRLKQLLLDESSRIAQRIPPVLQDAMELHVLFKQIQTVLDSLQGLTVGEKGGLPEFGLLVGLWQRVARPHAYAENQTHHTLLRDLARFYSAASANVADTVVALHRVSAELRSFRDDFANVDLVMHDLPFSSLRSVFERTAERLQASQAGLESTMLRGRQALIPPEASTKTIYTTIH